MRARRSAATARAASNHSATSRHGLSPASVPETTWKGMRARANAFEISGTEHTEQFASHSPVSVLA